MKFIYALIDPRDNRIRYIGHCASISRRMRQHSWDARHGRALPVYDWMRGLMAESLKPDHKIIEQTGNDIREAYWIEHYRQQGEPLLNLASGGRTGWRHHEDTKIRMQTPHSDEHRANATVGRLRALADGRGVSRGDKNGIHLHPELVQGTNNGNAKMDDSKVRQMRLLYDNGTGSTNTLAKDFGISQCTCWKILRRLAWKHVD